MNDITPDEAKASLGIATALQGHLMPQAPQKQDQPSETPADPKIEELEGKFNDLQKEVKTTIKDEMGGLKDMIKEALKEDDKKE